MILRSVALFAAAIAAMLVLAVSQGYYEHVSAEKYVIAATDAIYTHWDFVEFEKRADAHLRETSGFLANGPRYFATLKQQLGSMTHADPPKGEGGVNLAFNDPDRPLGPYARYVVQAKFEHGTAELKMSLIKKHGKWAIDWFLVESHFAGAQPR